MVIQTQVSLIPEYELVSTLKVPSYRAMICESMNSAQVSKSPVEIAHLLMKETPRFTQYLGWGGVPICLFLCFRGMGVFDF